METTYFPYLPCGLAACLLLAAAGCSDEFVTRNPQDALATQAFFRTAEDANLALTGVYDALQADFLYAQRNNNDASLRERETFTDNAMNGYLYQAFNNIKTGTLDPSNGIPLLRPWTALYRGIGRANQVIANVPGIAGLEEEERGRILGQAKAIRALMYWNLTNGWDDVPLILEPQEPGEYEVPKADQLAIYEQIVADLEDAIAALPEQWTGADYGRITSHAARGLLARVHLFFHGYREVEGAAAEAARLTGEIIDSGQFSLFDGGYEELFKVANEDNAEIIWSVRFGVDLEGNNGEGFSFSFGSGPQTNNQPLPNLADAFYATDGLPITESPLYNPDSFWLNRDPRWDATLVYDGEVWLEGRPAFNAKPNNRRTGYRIDKWIYDVKEGTQGDNNGQDWYIIRYADVLLMRAEALLETEGPKAEVYTLINQVRQRVGMPTVEEVEGSGLGYEELTDILRHERRVELAFENTRFNDLKRWGTMEEAYERSGGDRKLGSDTPILSNVSYQGQRSIILPIPQQELDANPALEQHPAWQ
jgi:hypothetical protein